MGTWAHTARSWAVRGVSDTSKWSVVTQPTSLEGRVVRVVTTAAAVGTARALAPRASLGKLGAALGSVVTREVDNTALARG